MRRFYRGTITKRPIGSAVQYRKPRFRGDVLRLVFDTESQGDIALFVVDCDDNDHAYNLGLPGVTERSEKEAVSLAAEYQPKQTIMKLDPITRKRSKKSIAALNLKKILKEKITVLENARSVDTD